MQRSSVVRFAKACWPVFGGVALVLVLLGGVMPRLAVQAQPAGSPSPVTPAALDRSTAPIVPLDELRVSQREGAYSPPSRPQSSPSSPTGMPAMPTWDREGVAFGAEWGGEPASLPGALRSEAEPSPAHRPSETPPDEAALPSASQGRPFRSSPLGGSGATAAAGMPALPDRQGAAAALTPPLPTGADLVLCLDTQRVWGVLGAGETVTVTVNGVQMGAAHSDGIGFFWTTLYDPDGQRPGLGSGDVVAIHHDGVQAASVTLRSIEGAADLLSDVVSGTVGGSGHPLEVVVYVPWGEPSPTTYSQTTSTDGSGGFSVDWTGVWDVMEFDEPVVGYLESGVEVHRTVYPASGLLVRPAPENRVMGYAVPGTALTATLYESDQVTVKDTTIMTSDARSGWYYWTVAGDVQPGDVVAVELADGTVMSRTIDVLTAYVDPATDQVTGTSTPSSTVGCLFASQTLQGSGWFQAATTADATGQYTLSLGSSANLLPGYFAYVFVPDDEGHQLNVYGPSPSVVVHQTWDEVSGRVGPYPGPFSEGQPVTLTVRSAAAGSSSSYSKNSESYGWYWFGSGDGVPDIVPGDIVTVTGAGWQGVVQVKPMTVEHDLAADQLQGTVQTPTERVELNGWRWRSWLYPVGGVFETVVTATAGVWSATLDGFDLTNENEYDVLHRAPNEYAEILGGTTDWIGVELDAQNVLGNAGPPGTAYTFTLRDSGGTPKAQLTGTSEEPLGFTGSRYVGDTGERIEVGDQVQLESAAGFNQTVQVVGLSALCDSDQDLVYGTGPADSRLLVELWNQGRGFVSTDASGRFTVTAGQLQSTWGDGDLLASQGGSVEYLEPNGNWVYKRITQRFVRVNYAHDWVQGDYVADHTLWITVTDSISVPKASAAVSSTYGGGWGGPGFETQGDDWSPSRPDIEPGDWVLVRSDDGYYNVMHIGTITGTVDADSDSVTGRVYATWFTETLDVEAHVWECCGAPNKSSTAAPDGSVPYFCQWDPDTEWDVLKGHQIAVMYIEPDGDRVFNVVEDPSLDLHMRVNYGGDVVQGNYWAGHTLWITVTESFTPHVKATAELTTGLIPGWGGQTGFSSNLGDPWVPGQPDIQPDDWVFGTADNGYSSTVRIGTITGELDVDTDTISGTIDANWFAETLNGHCSVWEPGGPGIDFTVDPDGGSYSCDFGAQGWDLLPGQNVGVEYWEPDEDLVINAFREVAPDLRVEKWVEGHEAAAGGMAVYGIRYRNEGDGVAETVTLTDTLPLSATYVADSSGMPATLGAGWVSWELGPLDPGVEEWFQLALSNTASPSDTLRNVVDIYTADDSDPGDEHAEAEMHVGDGQPDVYVDKWSEPGDPAPGQTFLYQINCGNYGPVASGPVWLTDTLPLSTTLVSWHTDKGYGLWTEVVTTGGQVVLWAPAIPGYWEDRIQLRLRVDESVAVGTQLTNTVEVQSAVDSNPDNNWRVHDSTWVGEPRWDVAIQKGFEWHNWGRLVPGGELEYWVQYSNRGNMAAHAWISDTLPEGTSFQGAWWRESERVWPSFEPTYVDGQVVAWDLGTLEPGDWPGFRLRLAIDAGITPDMEISNCVEIDIAGEDEQPQDNVSCEVVRVNQPGANLRLRKHYYWEGDGRLRYDIDFWNVGTEDLHDVRITDTYPLSTTWDGSSWTWGPVFSLDHDPGQRQLVFSTEHLYSGWTGRVGFRVDLDSEVIGIPGMAFTNTVQAPMPGDVYADDNYDEVVAYNPVPQPDVHVEKWLEGHEAAPGGVAVFTIRYRNDGEGVAETVMLTDTLPVSTTYVADSSGITPTLGAGWVRWEVGPLDPDQEERFQIVLTNTASLSDTLRNVVDIHTADDTDPGDDHAEAEVHVGEGQPDPWVYKWPEPSDPAPGQTFLYNIDYGNNGPVASGPVLLTDTLPVSTTLVSWHSQIGYTLWSEVMSTGSELVLSAASIPGYWSDRIKLRLRVDGDVAVGTRLTNGVEVHSAWDNNPDNNHHTDESTLVSEPRWDAACQKDFWYGRLAPGGETNYFLEFGNRGNMPVQTWLTDTLPQGTTLYDAKLNVGGSLWVDYPPTSIENGVVSWDLGVVEPGDWRRSWVRTTIQASASPGSEISNCVSIAIDGVDGNPEDNEACVQDVLREAGPNLRVEKRYWWEGDGRIGYGINYWNVGTENLSNVCLTDTYPLSTTWDGSASTWGPWVDVTHDAGNRRLVFCTPNLNAGDHGGIDFRVDLDAEIVGRAGMAFTNTVEAPIAGDVYPDDNYYEVVVDTGPVVGYTNVDLVRDYNGESNVGNLVTDGMLWKADLLDDGEVNGSVEICFTNPGGLRVDILIPEGAPLPYPITWQNTFDLMPFGNTLLLMDLTGAQIQELLDQAATLYKGILQSAGTSWYWYNNCHCTTPTSWGAYGAMVNGEPLDPGRTYRVVTNNWLAAGGDGWVTFADGTNRWDTGYDMQEAVNDYIGWYNANVGPIDYQVEGRIRLVDTLYVDAATGSDAGNYCRDAVAPCQTIGHALSQAVNGSSILVAAGIYTENLIVSQVVELRGGYEAAGWTRDLAMYETTIDGSAGGQTVVLFVPGSSGAALDGFTVTGGAGEGGVAVDSATVAIASCQITGNTNDVNWGGGVYATNGADVLIHQTVISDNVSGSAGGVGLMDGAAVTLVESIVSGNSTTWGGGGGIGMWWGAALMVSDSVISDNSTPSAGGGIHISDGAELKRMTNSLVVGNQAAHSGAGVDNWSSRVTLMNVTVADNSCSAGDDCTTGVSNGGAESVLTITNSILALNEGDDLQCDEGTCIVSYSDIGEALWPGTGNISADPAFVYTPTGDYRLLSVSPCIDQGTPAGAPAHDIEGTPRDAAPDMGAYEFVNYRPTLGMVDPSSGSGPTGVTTYFTTTWKDANSWQDLKQCYFHVGASPSIVGSVTLMYNAVKNKLWLRNDAGTAWTGGYAPGSANVLQNSQALVHCDLSAAQGSGDTLSVKWAIEFKPGFEGTKKLGLKCKDRGKARAKAKWKGTWTITP